MCIILVHKHMRNCVLICSTNTRSVSFVYQLFKNYTNTTTPLSSSSSSSFCAKDTLDNQSHLPHRHFFLALTHSATDAADFFLFSSFNPSMLFFSLPFVRMRQHEPTFFCVCFFFTICRFFSAKYIEDVREVFFLHSKKFFWVIFFMFRDEKNSMWDFLSK